MLEEGGTTEICLILNRKLEKSISVSYSLEPINPGQSLLRGSYVASNVDLHGNEYSRPSLIRIAWDLDPFEN